MTVIPDPERANPLEFTMRWPVRGYELDSRGHVNNAVYLSWAEEVATAHAEAAGYGRAWSEEHGGGLRRRGGGHRAGGAREGCARRPSNHDPAGGGRRTLRRGSH